MSAIDRWGSLLILAPSMSLLLLGAWLTIRSGVMNLTTGQGRRLMMTNVSRMAILTALCLVALVALQQLVGFRLTLAFS